MHIQSILMVNNQNTFTNT